MVNTNRHENVYEQLCALAGFKFKAHLKGTDIIFKDIYKMHNLVTGNEDYLLIIEGNKSIRFTDAHEFATGMVDIIQQFIKELNNEYRELNKRQQSDAIVDEVFMFERHEYIGYTGDRLLRFLNALRERLKDE